MYKTTNMIMKNPIYLLSKNNATAVFADIKKSFNSVDAVGNKRFVFNIKGNHFRIVALILFTPKILYIRFVGTHKEYDNIEDIDKI